MTRQADTGSEARAVQLAVYRAMGPERRVLAAFRMSEEARRIAAAGARARHPEWSEAEVERAVAELLLGAELARLVRQMQPQHPAP